MYPFGTRNQLDTMIFQKKYNIDVRFSSQDAVYKFVGWGPWSEWTSCSQSCSGGIQTR